MSITSSQTYLVSVLRRLEGRLAAESCRDQSMTVARLARRHSTTGDVEKELERLYCVKGLDRLALGLMWVASTSHLSDNGGKPLFRRVMLTCLMHFLIQRSVKTPALVAMSALTRALRVSTKPSTDLAIRS